MPAKVKFEIDSAGVAGLLKSGFVAADVASRAQAIAAAAGSGWQVESGLSLKGDRAGSRVFTHDPKTLAKNKKNHTLMRAIDAGRG